MPDGRFEIPSTAALIAFEAAGRLKSVTLAADELNSSQPAISRHIRNLESVLGKKLLRRSGAGVALTKDGDTYHATVQTSLEALHAAGRGLGIHDSTLIIACTQEISVLLLLPVASRLKRSAGENVSLRILNCDYDLLSLVVPTGVDITFKWTVSRTVANSVRLLSEEIVPVASAAFVTQHERVLARHPRHWSGLPRLEVADRGQGWASWETWFTEHECEPPPGPVEHFENYICMLEAAANGGGLALGWNGFVNGYLRTGQLAAVRNAWTETNLGLCAVLTSSGLKNQGARKFQRALAEVSQDLVDSAIPSGPAATSQAAKCLPPLRQHTKVAMKSIV